MSYVLAQIAEQDIEEIITYIIQENPREAREFVDAMYGSFELLADNPYIGYRREDLTDRPVRFWTFKWHYLVVYQPAQPLEIVRVLSGFRDVANLLN